MRPIEEHKRVSLVLLSRDGRQRTAIISHVEGFGSRDIAEMFSRDGDTVTMVVGVAAGVFVRDPHDRLTNAMSISEGNVAADDALPCDMLLGKEETTVVRGLTAGGEPLEVDAFMVDCPERGGLVAVLPRAVGAPIDRAIVRALAGLSAEAGSVRVQRVVGGTLGLSDDGPALAGTKRILVVPKQQGALASNAVGSGSETIDRLLRGERGGAASTPEAAGLAP